MSGLAAVFSRQAAGEDLLHAMLRRMSLRGSGSAAIWAGPQDGAALAVARNPWERGEELSGAALVVSDGDLVAVADATLYYRDDLVAALAAKDVCPTGATPTHLILAAYRAWGAECVAHLEGDYAFIVWDRRHHRVFCARDFAGSRPLYFAALGDTLVVASTTAAVLAHPSCPTGFNRDVLAETALNVWLPAGETAYSAVQQLPPGFALSWAPGDSLLVARHWHPPLGGESGERPAPFADAAAELRELLVRATAQRLPSGRTSAIWMSGGRDSPAVFAAGQTAIRRGRVSGKLEPVSVSYPLGDKGREDEAIAAIAAHWDSGVHWLDIRDAPLFADAEEDAPLRDEPYELPYVACNRALARRSRAVGAAEGGARVVLDGWGGDQLFQMTPIYLADLFRTGRWLALARELRALQVRDYRYLFRLTVAPVLPAPLLGLARAVRGGRPLAGPSAAWIPTWITPRCAARLAERLECNTPVRRDGSFTDHELELFLTSPTVTRARARLSALALEQGLEARFPLYDARIVALAATRPRDERRSGRETKTLLRAALRGLLPDSVLAPRPNRTGVTDDYIRTAMRGSYLGLLDDVLNGPVLLAELGIVEPDAWRRAAHACMHDAWSIDAAMALWFTLQTEVWLRGKTAARDVPDDGHSLAVLSPGERPGFHSTGGELCTSHPSSSASALSES